MNNKRNSLENKTFFLKAYCRIQLKMKLKLKLKPNLMKTCVHKGLQSHTTDGIQSLETRFSPFCI